MQGDKFALIFYSSPLVPFLFENQGGTLKQGLGDLLSGRTRQPLHRTPGDAHSPAGLFLHIAAAVS
jgi:hypothetical protein